MRGTFVVIDGLDGIGKGEIELAIKEYEEQKGTKILDLKDFWKEHHRHPEIHELEDYNMLISAEPTRAWIGASIRGEITADNKRIYSALSTAHSFALDRLILMKRVILPALEKGIKILQSRSVVSSLVYQQVQAKEQNISLTPEEIMQIEGNRFQLDNPPSLLIIPTIHNVEEVIKRLSGRFKKDKCEFENLEFQKKIKPLYESEWLKNLLTSKGSEVKYLDVGVSIPETRRQAVEMWKQHTE
ncbi:MAG: hypothetical protein ABIB47_02955 [Candidatus Woesearchaeota archaeon]